MNRALFAAAAVVAALVSSGAAQTPIRTVILSDHGESTFTVSAGDAPSVLKFPIGSFPIAEDATVEQCRLRVVPTQQGAPPRADQDVTVLAQEEQVGQWTASGENVRPYSTYLAPADKVWRLGAGGSLTLQTESEDTEWTYHGGAAKQAAQRPRLIVTYKSPSRPTLSRSGQAALSSTSWKLPDGRQLQLRSNPVSYGDAWYLIAQPEETQRLFRVAADGVTDWQLDGIDVVAKSFAFVTTWGRLQIITKDAIGSCDLENIGAPDSVVKCSVREGTNPISVEPGERPAMGPDGSLYFRNVQASNRIVAYNASFQEIWQTGIVFTSVSPISLSENGHFAYTLVNFLDEYALVRIDTATGETLTTEIKYTDSEGDEVSPILTELLQPTVDSNENTDYVFVAGNTDDTGIFQLVAFEPDQDPKVLWSRMGKVDESEASVDRRFSMTRFGDASLGSYSFDGSAGSIVEGFKSAGSAGALLADGAAPLLVLYTNQDLQDQLDEFAESLKEQDQTLDRELGEITKSLTQQDQKLDRELGEVTKSLEQQDQKLDEVSTSLAEQRQELAEVKEQISKLMPPDGQQTKWVAWAAVAIGICSLLACWILTRKERTG